MNNNIKNFKNFYKMTKNDYKIDIINKKKIDKSSRLYTLSIQNRFLIKIYINAHSDYYKFYPNNDEYFIISNDFLDFIKLLSYLNKIINL